MLNFEGFLYAEINLWFCIESSIHRAHIKEDERYLILEHICGGFAFRIM